MGRKREEENREEGEGEGNGTKVTGEMHRERWGET